MKRITFSQLSPQLDRLGVFLSATCLLHCLALPILLTLAPMTQIGMLDEHSFHAILLWFIVPISLVALSISCWQHKDKTIVVLGVLGLGILIATGLSGHTYFDPMVERLLTILAGLILAIAHLRNFKICRETDCDHA